MGAGLIFAAIAVAWVAYLVPMWVRRDEAGPTHNRSSDRMRLVGSRRRLRSGTVTTSGARGVGTLHTGTGHTGTGHTGTGQDTLEPSGMLRPPVSRRTARRRRRTLGLLLLTALVLGACAFLRLVPTWTVALPFLAIAGYVVLLRRTTRAAALAHRRQLARRAAARVSVSTESLAHSVRHVSVRMDVLAHTASPALDESEAPPAIASRRAAAMEPGQLDDSSWAAPDDGSWEPVAVPLPTYVTAPKARRSIRTIDLSSAGAWTSGRLEADAARAAELPAAYLPAPAAVDDEEITQRRAVGD